MIDIGHSIFESLISQRHYSKGDVVVSATVQVV
jgi:hypothetical protein